MRNSALLRDPTLMITALLQDPTVENTALLQNQTVKTIEQCLIALP